MDKKITIGFIGPDIISFYGGLQTHTINVIKILNNYFNIIYFLNPYLYKKYKIDKNILLNKTKKVEDNGIHITNTFYDIINNNHKYNEIIKLYSKEDVNFYFDLDFIDGFLDKNFTRKIDSFNNKPLYLCLQGMGDYNLHFYKHIKYTLNMIFISKNIKITSSHILK
ncbi:hypothetical protein OXIME_000750 [Oxyplasma meridianum]|uniref:Glycosyltransferase family 1 protein n=1 Tax=Oxyplasma meridianum TaxID=3073602 RepID=A0AAX4NFT7_9ARCH